MSQDYTPHLLQAQALLQDLIAHINAFDIERLLYHAPITDRIKFKESPWGQEEVMGMRKWIEGIHHHARILESLTLSGIPPKEDPLPTVQGLITYWKIIVTSKPPIVGVRMTMGGEKRIQAGNKLTNGQRSGASTPLGARKGGSNGASSVKGKEKEVWVDVVADGGKEWIRIYSKKISHLLAEFREADSYINSDYDSETDEENLSEEAGQSGPTRKVNSGTNGEASDTPSNSLLEMARDLSRAASMVDRIPGAEQPKLNIRLTRIPERAQDLYNENDDRHFPSSGSHEGSEWPDSRIPDTFDRVRSMGVNLLFGDLSDISLSSPLLKGYPVPAEAVPSLKINLDITTLMGLCSDVLHYPLPANRQEAARRSLRPADQLLVSASGQVGSRGRDGTGRGKGKGKKEDKKELEEEDEELRGQSQNSRELFRCILEEMERPFIEEFDKVLRRTAWNDQKRRTKDEDHQREARALNDIIKDNATDVQDRLSELATDESNMPRVEFWTTRQAAQYTYEALSSGPAHGYGAEQRRMRRMLGLEKGDFFEGSRYEGKAGIFGGFKLRIFDTNRFEPGAVVIEETRAPSLGLPGGEESDSNGVTAAKTGFHRTLASITQLFLDQYYASIPPSLSEQTSSSSSAPTATTIILPNFLQPKKIPTPPIAKITLPFPVVSLHSLQRGAEEGMTTVMMGTATLKEVWGQTRWRVRGWERGWYDLDWKEVDGHNSKDEQEEWKTESRPQRRERGPTAVMIFPYRVFGEGKRVRFEKGDYSYPAPQ